MKMEVKGMDQLKKNFEQVIKSMKSLDGEIARLHFNPNDPADVNRAVREFERKVDSKVGLYGSRPAVREVVTGIKKEFQKAILKRAEEARRKL